LACGDGRSSLPGNKAFGHQPRPVGDAEFDQRLVLADQRPIWHVRVPFVGGKEMLPNGLDVVLGEIL